MRRHGAMKGSDRRLTCHAHPPIIARWTPLARTRRTQPLHSLAQAIIEGRRRKKRASCDDGSDSNLLLLAGPIRRARSLPCWEEEHCRGKKTMAGPRWHVGLGCLSRARIKARGRDGAFSSSEQWQRTVTSSLFLSPIPSGCLLAATTSVPSSLLLSPRFKCDPAQRRAPSSLRWIQCPLLTNQSNALFFT